MKTQPNALEATWTPDELEHLGQCPICESKNRVLKFANVEDHVYRTKGKWNYYQCKSCGIYYIDPRPREGTIDRAYTNYFTHSPYKKRHRSSWLSQIAMALRNDYLYWKYAYDKQPRITGGHWLMYALPPWLRHEWDHHARHLPKPESGHDRLLDVGCGNGKFLKDAQLAGWQCYGVDFDPQAVKIAKSQGAKVSLGALEKQGFPDKFFNAITLSHVIEHVHQPKKLLEECVRILQPEGTLWIATPNIDSILSKWFKKDWLACVPPQHLILFNRQSLGNLLDNTGFSVQFERRGAHIQRHYSASRAFKQGKTGIQELCLTPFNGSQTMLRYWWLELFVWLIPSKQGDIIAHAVKK